MDSHNPLRSGSSLPFKKGSRTATLNFDTGRCPDPPDSVRTCPRRKQKASRDLALS